MLEPSSGQESIVEEGGDLTRRTEVALRSDQLRHMVEKRNDQQVTLWWWRRCIACNYSSGVVAHLFHIC